MDPPYGANVMYAELSDFFYVWLKRTAGLVVPELFTRRLADKDAEAVANKAHFKGQKGAARLADDDYRVKMEGIFAESRRVLKDDGIMTVMFTHKDTGAWDALAMSLMDAGFVITASWPVNTEASGSLHIKDKAAANSTIFLVCRPPDGRYPGRRSLSRQLWSSAGGIFSPLAVDPRHASSGAEEEAPNTGRHVRGVRSLRRAP
jgi:putative DNA methylase